jgi:hypothetical protein
VWTYRQYPFGALLCATRVLPVLSPGSVNPNLPVRQQLSKSLIDVRPAVPGSVLAVVSHRTSNRSSDQHFETNRVDGPGKHVPAQGIDLKTPAARTSTTFPRHARDVNPRPGGDRGVREKPENSGNQGRCFVGQLASRCVSAS